MKQLFKDILILILIVISLAIYGHFSQVKFSVKLEEITLVKLAIAFAFLLGFIILVRLHFLPYRIARDRKHRNTIPILLTNIFFGWTFVGWCVALIWANTCNVETENVFSHHLDIPTAEKKPNGYADKWNRAA